MEETQLNETFSQIVNGERFTTDQLYISTNLSKDIIETEEFAWYSKMYIAIQDKEELSSEEKIHFLAMYRSFLQLIN